MQMFGIGILELMVVLFLAAVVVGPDRLPAFAADLARWIRRARAYGQHLTRDFNDVMGELEKEAGASREDWKEIASLVTHHTGGVQREISKLTGEIEKAGNVELDLAASQLPEPASNVVPFDGNRNGDAAEQGVPLGERTEAADGDGAEPRGEDAQPWYVPERTTRRRSRE